MMKMKHNAEVEQAAPVSARVAPRCGIRVRDLLCSWIPSCRLAWSDANDTTPLEQICARVDHVNSLQEELPEQNAASEAVRMPRLSDRRYRRI